jgi:hypothetical protein
MPRERLRSNAQVRTAGIDGSVWFIVFGLGVSAVVLLTMLGSSAETRRARQTPAGVRSEGRVER